MEVVSLGDDRGHRFSLLYRPGRQPIGSVLYIHPFAEEMNKARRMAALQARLLAEQGWFVLQPDLWGCGDSAGDFGDASWDDWLDDVVRAAQWLRAETGLPTALWGLRSGCLLAAAAAGRLSWSPLHVFWQPVVAGRQHLQQFLRLKVAGEMLAGAQEGKTGTAQLKEALFRGQSQEIAGYRLAPDMARGLDVAKLVPTCAPGRVLWLEIVSGEAGALSPAAMTALSAWQEQGWKTTSVVLSGPAFWQTQEIELLPSLLTETANWMAAASA